MGMQRLLADFLSIITIALCLIMKVPQVKTVVENKSAEGISPTALCLELFSYTVMMCYNYTSGYDALSYLEYPILLVQEYILIFFVFKYKNLWNDDMRNIATAYAVVMALTYIGLIPSFLWYIIVPFCTPIGASSKILQFVAIIRARDSKSVSCVAWSISAFTNLTRVYTNYIQSGDSLLMKNFVISFLLSTAVLLAALHFKKPKVH